MSLDEPHHSSTPPGSSERASPAPSGPRRQLEDEPRRQDKTYRRYATGIDRALATFDTTRLEWPDYISFLGRLLKAIQSHPPAVDSLPHKSAVAYRLAQCLRPSLPSGVHQKAIEVYSYIFSIIGKQSLSLDLYIYLPGLLPVFTFASLTVRPTFLSLLETHIVSLDGVALRPALKALILGLLPGLEDDTSDDFDRTLNIVDSLKDAISAGARDTDIGVNARHDQYFWQCFFLASIGGSSRRIGALAFLVRRLPKLLDPHDAPQSKRNGTLSSNGDAFLSEDTEAVISPEPGLLIRCLAAGLEDNQILVQRGYLDLLLTHLPLHSPVLAERVAFDDLVRLVSAAITVLLRRDMSLNRRLWAWFLGPAVAEDKDQASSEALRQTESSQATKYFVDYGSKPLVASISGMLEKNSQMPAARAKPFRMCLSLMDHREIGGVVVPQIFLLAMQNIRLYSKHSIDSEFQDVLRSASSFFDGIESGIIWAQMLSLTALELTSSEATNTMRLEKLELSQFIVGNFNIQDEEMVYFHIPLVLLALISAISHYSSEEVDSMDDGTRGVQVEALQLADQLVRFLPERLQLNSSFEQEDVDFEAHSFKTIQLHIISLIETFYTESFGMLSLSPPPFSSKSVSEKLLSESAKLFLSKARQQTNIDQQIAWDICMEAKLFTSLLSKLPNAELVDVDKVVRTLNDVFLAHSETATKLGFINLKYLSQLLVILNPYRLTFSEESDDTFSTLISNLAEMVWNCLSPECPKYHLEAVRCLWQLDELMPDESVIESLTARTLTNTKGQEFQLMLGVDAANKFSVLWSHTPSLSVARSRSIFSLTQNKTSTQEDNNYKNRLFRPLCLLLDALDDTQADMQYFLRSWLQGLSNIDRIFEILISNVAWTRSSLSKHSSSHSLLHVKHEDSSAVCLYYMQKLLGLLNMAPEHGWTTLSQPLDSKAEIREDEQDSRTLLEILARECLTIIQDSTSNSPSAHCSVRNEVLGTSLSILRKSLESFQSISLRRLKLEDPLIVTLRHSLVSSHVTASSQLALLDTLSEALRIKSPDLQTLSRSSVNPSKISFDGTRNSSKLSLSQDNTDIGDQYQLSTPPSDLIKCIQEGLTQNVSVHVLDRWIQFISDILPFLSSTLFQCIIPLVEALCARIRKMFDELKLIFRSKEGWIQVPPEAALMTLLGGLELILVAGHEQLAREEPKRTGPKSPEPQQSGFFGTVVSGVFSSDAQKSRNAAANTRLTIILCFQDALRVCLDIWSWGGQSSRTEEIDPSCLASYAYVSQRLRNKTRRMLDRMFTAEALECLETLIVIWTNQDQSTGLQSPSSVSLLHVLEGSSPKRTIPAIFNAVYSRTIPSSIDSNWMSTLTSELTEFEIAQFLIEYTSSLDDDAMDEIWADCMTFLRDVLTNPLPHHQILPSLLVFIVILAEKVDKTNFGEQRKMRKDLADLFLRYLTAAFTTRSGGSYQEISHSRTNSELPDGTSSKRRLVRKPQYLDFVEVLADIVPRLSTVLADADRLATAVSNISTNVITPLVHAKTFPGNAKAEYLGLWLTLMKITAAAKILKKDLSEAFMHAKFFSIEASLAKSHWSPLLYQWTLSDKDRVAEIFSRVSAPASAGIMFGVGATAARLEADKKTQLNLRRIAFLILSAEEDHAVPTMATIEEKMVDLFNASAASSPSSATRAEVFMLLRALILNTNSLHLSSLWPIVTFELQKALTSALNRSAEFDTYSITGLLQACKLLDLLITLQPDDFQVHEWLFITDTIDAVYHPGNWEPVALADDLADELGSALESLPASPILQRDQRPSTNLSTRTSTDTSRLIAKYRTPLLGTLTISQRAATDASKEGFVSKVLRPFFAQLSLHAYESTYGMKSADVESCKIALIEDLFDDSTLVG